MMAFLNGLCEFLECHAILTFLFGHCRRGLILAVLAMMRVMRDTTFS
jgi:hypothetical protein